ncbi:MFS transporter [Actinomadura sp. LD22]|uniref:MFS transporter n=1 Tax=Actinomadura physcomitrii TaxID=2650748 RepID=A0A6I4MAS8_9ACTN|nr:MFS transporter [Actinomadura physcomitrii]MWA02882.1 MFS transporter [Actinomadura physcomitrii]
MSEALSTADDATGAREERQSTAFLPLYVLAIFGCALPITSAATVAIPLRLAALDPADKTRQLSLIVAIGGAVVMLVTAPLGRISDVSASRFGARRPFILGGAVVGACGMLVLACAASVPVLIAGWVLTQAGFAATTMALQALLAEAVPSRTRARVSAMFGLATGIAPFVGGGLIGALPGDPLWWFGVPAVIALCTSTAVAIVLRDVVHPERARVDWRSLLRSYWIDPVRHRDFAWAWMCRLLVTMSLVTVSIYLLFFLTDRLGIAAGDAARASGAVLAAYFAGSVATSFLAGWVSDRTGGRKLIVWTSTLLTAAGLLVGLFAQGLALFVVGFAIAGMGQGAFVAVDMAMMTEVLPATSDAGAGLAVVALSFQLPQLLVPAMAAPLLAIGSAGPNYFALFLGSITAAVLGALAVLPIKNVR